jgi:rare lipoprotein A
MSGGRDMARRQRVIVGLSAGVSLLMLSACGTTTSQPAATTGGGASEVRGPQGLYKVGKPYQIKGIWYYPQIDYGYAEEGVASWYGPGFHGKATANGEVYDQNEMTAAHRTLPLPSIVRVTNLENGRSIKVRVNDRGPFAQNRIIDMTRRGAQMLGFYGAGTARVRVEIDAEESRQLAIAMTGTDYPVGGTMVASRQTTAPIDAEAPVPVIGASSADPVYVAAPAAAATVDTTAVETAVASQGSVVDGAVPADLGQAAIGYEQQPQWAAAAMDDTQYGAMPAHDSPGYGYPATADSNSAPVTAVSSVQTIAIPPKPVGAASSRSVTPAPTPSGSQNAYVQAGAFANQDNADRVRQRLSRLGPVAVVNRSSGGPPLYRVRLGPLASVTEAERMLTAVKEAGYPGSLVVIE